MQAILHLYFLEIYYVGLRVPISPGSRENITSVIVGASLLSLKLMSGAPYILQCEGPCKWEELWYLSSVPQVSTKTSIVLGPKGFSGLMTFYVSKSHLRWESFVWWLRDPLPG